MTTVSVTEAKNNLSKLLKKVRHGQSILILDRNIPVARLEPLNGTEPGEDPRLAELERQGLISRGSGKLPKSFWNLPPLKFKKSLVQAVLDERRQSPW